MTVLLPVKNGERWIKECLDSLARQTFKDFELLMIDDQGVDRSVEIAREHPIENLRIVVGPGRGVAAALNLGVEEASAPLIARIDVDDVAEPDRLERQVDFMDANAQCGAVGTQATLIDESGRKIGMVSLPTNPRSIRFFGVFLNPLLHTSVMFRRARVQEVGGYWSPCDSPYPEDFDLWSRLAAVAEVRNISPVLMKYRKSQSSVMSQGESILGEAAGAIAIENARRVLGPQNKMFPSASLIGAFHQAPRDFSYRDAVTLARLTIEIRSRVGFGLAPRSGFYTFLASGFVWATRSRWRYLSSGS